jgi:hypothetical protein
MWKRVYLKYSNKAFFCCISSLSPLTILSYLVLDIKKATSASTYPHLYQSILNSIRNSINKALVPGSFPD